jgi:hypothetical protein
VTSLTPNPISLSEAAASCNEMLGKHAHTPACSFLHYSAEFLGNAKSQNFVKSGMWTLCSCRVEVEDMHSAKKMYTSAAKVHPRGIMMSYATQTKNVYLSIFLCQSTYLCYRL